jgi:hypothetical protein
MLQLRSFRNRFNRWVGFLPVECIGALKQNEDIEWPNSKGSPLELLEPREGMKGVVTMHHDGEVLWALDSGANEVFVFLVACDLAPAHRSEIGNTSNMSRIASAMVGNCASDYVVCPLPVDEEDWVGIPCRGRRLEISLYVLNPYSVFDLAVIRCAWR